MNQTIHATESAIQSYPAAAESQPAEESRDQMALRMALDRYRHAADWVTFFREVLGVEGIVRRLFPNPIDLQTFERSEEYSQIQQMLAKLRERNDEAAADTEPTRVITVRLPKSLHESLKAEAHSRQTSMNKLCISKLLQMIENSLVPGD